LDILDQSLGEVVPFLLILISDNRRYFSQAGDPGSPPPTLPGHQLEHVPTGADQDRLKNSHLPYRGGQILQRYLIEAGARLTGVWFDLVERYLGKPNRHITFNLTLGYQRIQAPAEASLTLCHGAS
jgi:hypothetical protein